MKSKPLNLNLIDLDAARSIEKSTASLRDLQAPFPIADFGHIVAELANVIFVIDQFIANLLFHIRRRGAEARNAVDDVADEMKTIKVV